MVAFQVITTPQTLTSNERKTSLSHPTFATIGAHFEVLTGETGALSDHSSDHLSDGAHLEASKGDQLTTPSTESGEENADAPDR